MCAQVHAELILKASLLGGGSDGHAAPDCRVLGAEGVMRKDFPESSFSIACQGDVCKGDEVLFNQGVFDGFDITTRGGGGALLGEFDPLVQARMRLCG